ncbi:MAG: hypothetical protein AAF438_19300 [Pseudomonadota bacterium]
MTSNNHRVERYLYEIRMENDRGAGQQRDLAYLYGGGDTLLCVVACVDDTQSLAPPKKMAEGYVAGQMKLSNFANMIDMLRNEKPVYFAWSEEGSALRIATGPEPVGEQELRKLFSFLYI